MLKTLSISCQYLVNNVSTTQPNCQLCQKLKSFQQVFNKLFDKQRLLSHKGKLLILPSKNRKLTASTITTIKVNIYIYSSNQTNVKNRLHKVYFSKKRKATTNNIFIFFYSFLFIFYLTFYHKCYILYLE